MAIGNLLQHVAARSVIFAILLLTGKYCFGQFATTGSYELIYEVPKAKKPGDTIYVRYPMKPYQKYDAYVFKKIDASNRYIYRALLTNLVLKIAYSEANRVSSYYFRYNEYGGEGKGFFVIHYYPNGNIRDYAQFSFYSMSQAGRVVLYDSLPYPEPDPSKINGKKYYTLYRRHKIYLYQGNDDLKVIRRKIRKARNLEECHIVSDLPYPTYLLK